MAIQSCKFSIDEEIAGDEEEAKEWALWLSLDFLNENREEWLCDGDGDDETLDNIDKTHWLWLDDGQYDWLWSNRHLLIADIL